MGAFRLRHVADQDSLREAIESVPMSAALFPPPMPPRVEMKVRGDRDARAPTPLHAASGRIEPLSSRYHVAGKQHGLVADHAMQHLAPAQRAHKPPRVTNGSRDDRPLLPLR